MIDLSRHKKRKVLVVDSNITDVNTANGRAVRELIEALEDTNLTVIPAVTLRRHCNYHLRCIHLLRVCRLDFRWQRRRLAQSGICAAKGDPPSK